MNKLASAGCKLVIVATIIFFSIRSNIFAQVADTSVPKPKPIGVVLRTVREIYMTNDTIPEILQIETSRAHRVRDIAVRFAIYKGMKVLYQHAWKAEDFFDKKDRLSDTIKWYRLQRIMHVFFSDQNFSVSDSEDISSLFERVHPVDIQPGSPEAKEFSTSLHKVFAVYAGRDMLYGITWLASKKKFVRLWRN